jgi:SAM-dependent methyltransferase
MMRQNATIERAMRAASGVRVTRDFEVERPSGGWDPKHVPIVINSFDRVTYLRRLVDALRVRGYENLYVIDNHSTYEPLLQYYRDGGLRVFYLDANVGYLALWVTPVGSEFVDDYYVYTDPDIEPAAECPADFIEVFHQGLERHRRVDKVGFGLKIDDLPDSYALKGRVIEHEKQFQPNRRGPGRYYRAAIDTTFALYRPRAVGGSWLRSLRTTEPYVAKHLPWYEDSANPTAEELHYLQTIGASTHWSLRGDAGASVLEVPLAGESVRVAAGRSDDLWNVVSRGEWKPELFEAIDRYVDSEHCYLEIGSGAGQTVLYAAKRGCTVYALEPDPDALAELRQNLALNADRAHNVYAQGISVEGIPASVGFPSFAEFASARDLSGCSLVSVDVDGRESRILSRILPYLRSPRPTVSVTVRPGRRFGLTTERLAGKVAIAMLGVLTTLVLVRDLRFYRHVYIGLGEQFTLPALFRNLSSRITITAGDHGWGAP